MKTPPLLASLVLLSACAAIRPDHTEPKDLPPPPRDEISWESLLWEPWPDPLHEKYEELFGRPFPNAGRQHYETDHPFDDVKKYQLAFEQAAIPGIRSLGSPREVVLDLPGSAGKTIAVKADDRTVRVTVAPPAAPRRYRVYRPEELVLPLPSGADPDTARVTRDGDRVRITFLERKS